MALVLGLRYNNILGAIKRHKFILGKAVIQGGGGIKRHNASKLLNMEITKKVFPEYMY